ncbi:MAG: STAS domain-containing protein [Terriglobales bacterium]
MMKSTEIKSMELEYQIERLQDVAVVRCSGRMVRGAALDGFRRGIEQLDRLRVLVLDLSEIQQLDAGGLGTLLLVRRWAMQNSARLKLVNPPVFFRRMLDATHLSTVFEISSLKEALYILRPGCTPRYAIA